MVAYYFELVANGLPACIRQFSIESSIGAHSFACGMCTVAGQSTSRSGRIDDDDDSDSCIYVALVWLRPGNETIGSYRTIASCCIWGNLNENCCLISTIRMDIGKWMQLEFRVSKGVDRQARICIGRQFMNE